MDAGGINRELVLENGVVVGSVNADLHHYRQAADALSTTDLTWLDRMITRRVPLADADKTFTAHDDVTVVITLHDTDG